MPYDRFRNFPRRLVGCPCPLHGSIGRKITEFLLRRHFQLLHRRIISFRKIAGCDRLVSGRFNDFLQFIPDFHVVPVPPIHQ